MEDRLTELEIKVTFQDDLIKKLNEVVIEMQNEVGAFRRRIERLERMNEETSG